VPLFADNSTLVLGKGFWIYWAVPIPPTLAVVATWCSWLHVRKGRVKEEEERIRKRDLLGSAGEDEPLADQEKIASIQIAKWVSDSPVELRHDKLDPSLSTNLETGTTTSGHKRRSDAFIDPSMIMPRGGIHSTSSIAHDLCLARTLWFM